MNKRNLNLEKYGISRKRYKELCGFCEQYPEWVQELNEERNTLKSPIITDMPKVHGISDQTGAAAITIVTSKKQEKCALIERTAQQASLDFWEYIIKSVCYEVPVTYLIDCDGMCLGKSAFYEIRRYFFYLLDKNKSL